MEICDFNINSWRAVCRQDDPPVGTVICTVDPQFASTGTDDTGLAAGVIYQLEDESHAMHLLDATGIKRKGAELGNGICDFLEKHKPAVTYVEGIPAAEILKDVIIWKAELRGVETGELVIHKPDRSTGAKTKRIRSLNSLVNTEPHRFFVQYAPFVDRLFEQLEKFDGKPGVKANRSRRDDIADAVSQLIVHLPF